MSREFTGWIPFVKLRYGFDSYKGRGSENWGDSDDAAYFLFKAENDRSARYVSRGAEIGIGSSFKISNAMTLQAEYGVARETLETNARIIDDDRVLSGKDKTAFPSRVLAFGGTYNY